MAIHRIRCVWTGFPGAPGISTFYSIDAPLDLTRLHGFFQNITGLLPSVVTISIPNSGDIIDEVTGNLLGGWSGGSAATSTGTATNVYAGPAGAAVTWQTGAVVDAHRVRGRTYLVPLDAGAFDSNGTLTSTAVATLQGAAGSLLTGTFFVVWHRPRAARAATGTLPALSAHPGSDVNITAATVADKVAILRSRRD